MTTNQKRGFRRLGLALLVPWLVVWATVYVVAAKIERDASARGMGYLAQAAKPTSEVSVALSFESMRAAGATREAAAKWRQRAEFIGPGGLVSVVFVGALGFWVWRGFRPRQP